METTGTRNTAILMQLSALTQYFIPLGNYIFPTVIWSMKKHDSEFVNYNGKQLINFQLSLLLYYLILGITSVTIFIYTLFNGMNISIKNYNECEWVAEQIAAGNITGMIIIAVIAVSLIVLLKIFEFFLIIYAAVKNSNGENYKYPLTINFIQ